jgi:hypothetical protein
MACTNLAPFAVRWLVASSLLVAACADGVPPGSLTFGFGSSGTPPDDSVGTFVDSTEGDDAPTGGNTMGATSDTAGPSDGPPGMCGDGVVGAGEVCDGTELGGQDCASQGFDDGELGCADDCSAFDTSDCVSFSCGNGLIEGGEACDGTDLAGQDCVTQGYDQGLLGCADDCTAFDTSGCAACGNGVIEGSEVCDGAALDGQTCVTQGFVGGNLGCAANCAAFDTAACTSPLPACVDQDLGSSVGSPVASGTTVGQNEAMPQNCGGNGAVDFVLRFIAPAAANYQFNTTGSTYDTVLSLHDTCGGAPLTCNDDSNGTLQSTVNLAMAAGQQVLIAVSGYSGATGNWTLNIIQM